MQRSNIGFQENQIFSMSIRAIRSFKYIYKKNNQLIQILEYLQKQKLTALQEVLNHSPPLKQNSVLRTDAIFVTTMHTTLTFLHWTSKWTTLNWRLKHITLKINFITSLKKSIEVTQEQFWSIQLRTKVICYSSCTGLKQWSRIKGNFTVNAMEVCQKITFLNTCSFNQIERKLRYQDYWC